MEAIETSNDEGYLKMAGLKMRGLATGVIVFTALFMMGLATEASAQSSSSIVVRARGTAGGESITLRVDNSNVATWTLTTSLQNYSASTNLTGNVTVAFTNDGTGRDVQVDYIVVNGTTRQSENQTTTPGSTRMAVAAAAPTANGCIATAPLHTGTLQFGQQHRRSCTWYGGH